MVEQQKMIDDTLKFISENGYKGQSNSFFKKTSKFLSEVLNLDFILIDKFSVDFPKKVKTVSFFGEGKILPNIEYELQNTPCNNVVNKDTCIYPDSVQELFPLDQFFVENNINSYIGVPLWSSSKKPIGLIALMNKEPIKNSSTIASVLQIIALKVEKCLEKMLFEEQLSKNTESLKLSENKIKEGEEQFKKLSNLTFEGILIHENGVAKEINLSFEKMFGYKKNEIINNNIVELLFPKKYRQIIYQKIKEKHAFPYEIKGKRKDGTIFPVEVESRFINLNNNEKRVTAIRDISKRKKSESENVKLRNAVERSNNIIIITDTKGNIEYTNPKFTEATGYTFNEVKGKSTSILNSGYHPKEYYSKLWKTISAGNNWSGEFRNVSKEGIISWEQATISPIKNEDNEIENFIAIKQDVTERKVADKKLTQAYDTIEENEYFLRNILRTANEGFWIINNEGLTREVNDKMAQILGYSKEFMIGKSIFEFVDEKNALIFKEQIKLRDKGISTSYEIELQNNEKQNVTCKFNTSPIYDKNEARIGSFGLVTDISDIKTTHKKLKKNNKELKQLSIELSEKNRLHLESEQRYKDLFEHSPVSLWEEDFSEAKEFINSKKIAPKKLLNYLNNNQEFLIECISKIKIINVNKGTLDLVGVDSIEELTLLLRTTNTKQSLKSLAKELTAVALNKSDFYGETCFTRADGKKIAAIVKSEIATNAKAIVSVIDITALKEAEQQLKIAKIKAEESNRLKTEFLNNMSHEIRTPMNGIIGFSKLLENEFLTTAKRKYFTSIIQNSSKQLLHIIDDILEISRLETKQVRINESEVNLNDLLLELFSVFDLKARENNIPLYLKNDLKNDESLIFTDVVKLNKILSNLLENALKFTNKGKIVFGYKIEDNKIKLFVEDSGVGILKSKQKLIFERFSREERSFSRNVGGLGLGLSIAKENTELLGGEIQVESEVLKGSTFYVTIPYKPVVVKPNKNTIEKNKKESYNVLIVEDDEVNCLFLEILLNEQIAIPFNLIIANNGKEAVEICENNSKLDLIFMDLNMPIMDGYEATVLIKKKFPKLPIIAQTAFSSLEDRGKAVNSGCNDFITKPIKLDELEKVINKFLIAKKQLSKTR